MIRTEKVTIKTKGQVLTFYRTSEVVIKFPRPDPMGFKKGALLINTGAGPVAGA